MTLKNESAQKMDVLKTLLLLWSVKQLRVIVFYNED